MRRWFGLKTPIATKTTGTHPVVHGKPVSFEVWLAPSMPPWDYVPTEHDGPFRLVRIENDGTMYGYLELRNLTEVIELFSRFHLPRRGETCVVLDRHANMLLGWGYQPQTRETYWTGCRHAYELLGRFLPVEAAMWETQAHMAADTVLTLGEMFRHDI